MYCIIVYDVSNNKVSKLCNFLRTYLNWVQNSVFEGEIDDVPLMKIKNFMNENLDKNIDSVIIYQIDSRYKINREIIGKEKEPINQII